MSSVSSLYQWRPISLRVPCLTYLQSIFKNTKRKDNTSSWVSTDNSMLHDPSFIQGDKIDTFDINQWPVLALPFCSRITFWLEEIHTPLATDHLGGSLLRHGRELGIHTSRYIWFSLCLDPSVPSLQTLGTDLICYQDSITFPCCLIRFLTNCTCIHHSGRNYGGESAPYCRLHSERGPTSAFGKGTYPFPQFHPRGLGFGLHR